MILYACRTATMRKLIAVCEIGARRASMAIRRGNGVPLLSRQARGTEPGIRLHSACGAGGSDEALAGMFCHGREGKTPGIRANSVPKVNRFKNGSKAGIWAKNISIVVEPGPDGRSAGGLFKPASSAGKRLGEKTPPPSLGLWNGLTQRDAGGDAGAWRQLGAAGVAVRSTLFWSGPNGAVYPTRTFGRVRPAWPAQNSGMSGNTGHENEYKREWTPTVRAVCEGCA